MRTSGVVKVSQRSYLRTKADGPQGLADHVVLVRADEADHLPDDKKPQKSAVRTKPDHLPDDGQP